MIIPLGTVAGCVLSVDTISRVFSLAAVAGVRLRMLDPTDQELVSLQSSAGGVTAVTETRVIFRTEARTSGPAGPFTAIVEPHYILEPI